MRSKTIDTVFGELSVARERLDGPVVFLLSTPICYCEPPTRPVPRHYTHQHIHESE